MEKSSTKMDHAHLWPGGDLKCPGELEQIDLGLSGRKRRASCDATGGNNSFATVVILSKYESGPGISLKREPGYVHGIPVIVASFPKKVPGKVLEALPEINKNVGGSPSGASNVEDGLTNPDSEDRVQVSLPWLLPKGVLPSAVFSQSRVAAAKSLPCNLYKDRKRTLGRKVASFLSMSFTTREPISGG